MPIYLINRIIGSAKENQGSLVGRNNEVIRTSQAIRLSGYIVNTNQGDLVGYFIDGHKFGAFDSNFG